MDNIELKCSFSYKTSERLQVNSFNFLACVALFFFYSISCFAQISVKSGSDTVGCYNLYELTINHHHNYHDNWDDVSIDAVFSGPQQIKISGFFYDNGIWKVRFAPPVPGNWSYNILFTTPSATYTAAGTFLCVPSLTKGFLTRHPTNSFRLMYPDGTLFNGIGLEDCMQDANADGTPLDDWGFDGGLSVPNQDCTRTGLKNYMNAYGINGAGFNIFRWTTENCSFRLFDSISVAGNAYDINAGKWGDTLVTTLRNNKIRLWLDFFGPPIYNQMTSATPLQEAAVKKYIKYVIARYGAYADIWELFNENFASDYYINTICTYIRALDPFHRLISISAEQPQMSAIDINSPHWYQKESELESDIVTSDRIDIAKKFNKPVIFGEQGNSVQNWDELSAERMRIRSWTAFFKESILIFWNTSCIKNFQSPISANIYLGPQERGYIRALQDFTVQTDTSAVTIPFFPANSSEVRAYGLKSAKLVEGYFHHYSTHSTMVNTTFRYRMNRNGILYWIDPASGKLLDSAKLVYGTQQITSPGFNVDIAMLIVIDSTPLIFNPSQKLDVLVYPNPASNGFYINGNFDGTASVKLFDVNGRIVLDKSGISNDQLIGAAALAKGLYIYKILQDGRLASGKIVLN